MPLNQDHLPGTTWDVVVENATSREIYRSTLSAMLEPDYDGQFVAIDVLSGEYEISVEAYEATNRLWARCPDAQILIERIGHAAAFHAYRTL